MENKRKIIGEIFFSETYYTKLLISIRFKHQIINLFDFAVISNCFYQ